MINLHLYPSPFLNESRILREAGTLARMGLFDRIDLVGTGQDGLAATEAVSANVRIVRMTERQDRPSLARKMARTATWSAAVYRRYHQQQLGCINCHSVATLPLGVMLKRATGARVIYDAHELETEANGLHGLRKRLTAEAERRLIRHADHCIFVGSAIEHWYRHKYGLANTTVIYNCPSRNETPPSRILRDRFGIGQDVPVFLYQGLIGEGRGVRILVDAFAGLGKRAALVVMGYGPLAGWMAAQAASHPNVFYHPAVRPAELPAYTAGADYGLSVIEATSLSYEYCMPNKLFEYVMARKPVIVSSTREQRRLVEHYGIGEVAAAMTPAAVREAVLRLLSRPRGVYEAGLEQARNEYCWERQERKLETVYRTALGFVPRPVPGCAADALEAQG